MEYAQKYWYVVIGAVVLLFVFARKGNQVTQVGSAVDVAGLAQISAAEREADENRRFGLFSTLLNYDLSSRGLAEQSELARISLSQQIRLAEISAEAQSQANENQFALAQMLANLQASQNNAQIRLQADAMDRQFNQQRRSDWLGAIATGLQTMMPVIFGRSTSGGGFGFPNTPTTFPSGGGFGGIRIGF